MKLQLRAEHAELRLIPVCLLFVVAIFVVSFHLMFSLVCGLFICCCYLCCFFVFVILSSAWYLGGARARTLANYRGCRFDVELKHGLVFQHIADV